MNWQNRAGDYCNTAYDVGKLSAHQLYFAVLNLLKKHPEIQDPFRISKDEYISFEDFVVEVNETAFDDPNGAISVKDDTHKMKYIHVEQWPGPEDNGEQIYITFSFSGDKDNFRGNEIILDGRILIVSEQLSII